MHLKERFNCPLLQRRGGMPKAGKSKIDQNDTFISKKLCFLHLHNVII